MTGANVVPAGFGDAFLNTTFVGELLLFVLYGCTLGQTVYYYSQYREDHMQLKALVAVLLLLDTAKVAAGAEIMYYYTVTNHQAPYNIAALPPLTHLGSPPLFSAYTPHQSPVVFTCVQFTLAFFAMLGFTTGIVWITELNIHDAATQALKGISAVLAIINKCLRGR
ncbi:hypothetical protein C8Q72DRAFT_794380 [Fomitopsis betulina]|nr:hypothetical protein C8Q72DRAFT_794380 [Fomitopsis betulina]